MSTAAPCNVFVQPMTVDVGKDRVQANCVSTSPSGLAEEFDVHFIQQFPFSPAERRIAFTYPRFLL